jgi:hypothetical protein
MPSASEEDTATSSSSSSSSEEESSSVESTLSSSSGEGDPSSSSSVIHTGETSEHSTDATPGAGDAATASDELIRSTIEDDSAKKKSRHGGKKTRRHHSRKQEPRSGDKPKSQPSHHHSRRHHSRKAGDGTKKDSKKRPTTPVYLQTSDKIEDESLADRIRRHGQRELTMLGELLKHTWHTVSHAKVNYCLGCSACCVVVLTVALFMTIIGNTPVVMLRLAELEAGEIDVKAVPVETRDPTGQEDGLTIDYRVLSAHLKKRTSDLESGRLESGENLPPEKRLDLTYTTARLQGQVQILAASDCPRGGAPMDPKWKYEGVVTDDGCVGIGDCFKSVCTTEPSSGVLFLVDTDAEKRMNLGRSWTWDSPKQGQALLQSSLASSLGLGPGDVFYLQFSARTLFGNWFSHAVPTPLINEDGIAVNTDQLIVAVKVEETFADATGKYSSDVSSGIVMEYDLFLAHVAQHINTFVPQAQV